MRRGSFVHGVIILRTKLAMARTQARVEYLFFRCHNEVPGGLARAGDVLQASCAAL